MRRFNAKLMTFAKSEKQEPNSTSKHQKLHVASCILLEFYPLLLTHDGWWLHCDFSIIQHIV